jgi:transposase-like protein
MDLIPRGERRRRWTTEQKQTIAAQSFAPGFQWPVTDTGRVS